MKKYFLLVLTICFAAKLFAQPFAVGHATLNVYNNASTGGSSIAGAPNWGSTGRVIGTHLYYPATAAGNNTPAANGQFPVVVLGHGFVMTYDSYNTLYEELAKQGFIVALPITEGGFAPVHSAFAADMAFLASQLPLLNTNNILPELQNHVAPKAAIGGHSMGAGCSMIGAQNNTTIYALFNMATATSDTAGVSSLVGAPSIKAPTLILSGERDCIADTSVQLQHYTACGASLKYVVILKNLTHCDFGNGSSVTCTIGQSTTGCGNTIPNAQANSAVLRYLLPFLQRTLKNDCAAADSFMNRINNLDAQTLRVRQQGNLACFPNQTNSYSQSMCRVFPNPAQSAWTIQTNPSALPTTYTVFDALGRICWSTMATENTLLIPCATWPNGLYWLQVNNAQQQSGYRLMKAN